MSHFTVLVVGHNPEEQLAPFQENNMGNCPKEYLRFIETESEYLQEFLNGKIKRVEMPDGSYVSLFDERFRVSGTFGSGPNTHIIPSDLEIVEVEFREIYEDFESFMREYAGFNERDPQKGLFGYWDNPNAKWDCYELGGRWTGFFKLKKSSKSGKVGSPGLFTSTAPKGYADQAKKSEIDFEFMREKSAQRAIERYDFAQILVGHLEIHLTWEEVGKKFDLPLEIESARKFYWNQPRCSVWKKEMNKDLKAFPLSWDSSPDDFLISREKYIQKAREGAICTFALLKDGNWYERGKMGWWAVVNQEKDEDVWNSEFSKMIDELPDEVLLSIYDCHV